MTERLHAAAVSRDAEASRLVFTFTREPTDDEMRAIHDIMNRLLSGTFLIVENPHAMHNSVRVH